MKLKYLIVLLCVMTAFVTMSCSDDEDEFTWHEYKLPVSASELNCPIDEPVLVNDQAELTRIVGESANPTKVDFNKHTLLIVKSTIYYGIKKLNYGLSYSNGRYILNILVRKDITTAVTDMAVAYVIPKTYDESSIELVINVD
ncbi:hypothetical protein [uncultured Muribaculum sp.]|uniref:hypothetical protein n=1 Tax=uncultured Muribaculum sp. TaxID=1918613 RepID=UPI002731CBB0|nr:hypothetical protein [uncultured Muribaculum sp.]